MDGSSSFDDPRKRIETVRKILVMGLPGAGKTTLARVLAPRLNGVHFNADEVRRHLYRDLNFTHADRIEHARRMGWLCDQVAKAGSFAVADFICPTPQTRAAFLEGGPAVVIWVDRIEKGRFEDTNRMFVPPDRPDIRVLNEGSAIDWVERILEWLDFPSGSTPDAMSDAMKRSGSGKPL